MTLEQARDLARDASQSGGVIVIARNPLRDLRGDDNFVVATRMTYDREVALGALPQGSLVETWKDGVRQE